MSKTTRYERSDEITFAPRVTWRHGTVFAKILLGELRNSEIPAEAFALSGVLEWPDDEEDDTPAKQRAENIENEIMRRTLNEIELTLSKTFEMVAAEVIYRERAKDRKS